MFSRLNSFMCCLVRCSGKGMKYLLKSLWIIYQVKAVRLIWKEEKNVLIEYQCVNVRLSLVEFWLCCSDVFYASDYSRVPAEILQQNFLKVWILGKAESVSFAITFWEKGETSLKIILCWNETCNHNQLRISFMHDILKTNVSVSQVEVQ